MEMSEWNSYGIATLLIQAISAGATLWAVWVALTPQRNADKIELYEPRIWWTLWLRKKSGIICTDDGHLMIKMQSYIQEKLTVQKIHFMKIVGVRRMAPVALSFDTNNGSDKIYYGRSYISTQKKNIRLNKLDTITIQEITHLLLSVDSVGRHGFKIKHRHIKQIANFINQK